MCLCELCHQNQAIDNGSHIIPRFVSEWIKRHSPTGGLIDSANPNPRQQDTKKETLLCQNCEQLFCKWENEFKKKIFLPYNSKSKRGQDFHTQRKRGFEYTGWLLRFATSLSWRIAVTQRKDLQNRDTTLFSYLENAIQSWEAYLLEKSPTNPYEHHLLLEGAFNSTHYLDASYYNEAYAHRTIDACTPSTSNRVAIYIKIPGIFFFTGVHPASLTGWKNSLIAESGIVPTTGQETSDPLFWNTLKDGSFKTAQAISTRSTEQKRKTHERTERKRNS